jgi:hypothetical protein
MLAFVVKHMATKDDITDVKSTLADHTKILNGHTRESRHHQERCHNQP